MPSEGRTDTYDEASSPFSQFYERAKKKKKANFHMAANKMPMKITFIRMHII
jgi:hypothetical protein